MPSGARSGLRAEPELQGVRTRPPPGPPRLVLRAASAPRTPARAPGHGSRCAGDTVGASAERGLGRPPTRLHLVVSRHPRLCRDHPTRRPPLGSAPRAGVSFVLGLVDAAPDRALSHAKAEGRRKAT